MADTAVIVSAVLCMAGINIQTLHPAPHVEMLFAHLKRILKLDRLRLRGPNGAKDEFLLAATAQNLRKLAKLLPTRPEPGSI